MGSLSLREALALSPLWDDLDDGVCIVACSGGRDSVALACVAADLLADREFTVRFKAAPKLALWHLDHGLRPDSAADADFVRELAANLRATCITERAELEGQPGNLEANARITRYERLCGLLNEPLPADNLPRLRRAVTAHHLGDQVETVLHHLVRGTHLRGLRAIAPVYQRHIYRPWLKQPPEAITAYLKQRSQTWREDSTNSDLSLTRNRLRNIVVPELTSINPQAREHVSRLADIATDVQTIVDQQVDRLDVESIPAIGLMTWLPLLSAPTGRYFAHYLASGWEHPTVLAEFIARQLKPRIAKFHAANYKAVSNWALEPRIPLVLHGVHISLYQGKILITAFPTQARDYPVDLNLAGHTDTSHGRLRFALSTCSAGFWQEHQSSPIRPWEFIRNWPDFLLARTYQSAHAGEWTCFLPAEVNLPLTIRNWHSGDSLVLSGGGRKKLGDVFTDAKVPEHFRDCWAVVLDASGQIIWVPGLADTQTMHFCNGEPPAWRLQIRVVG